MMTGAAAVATPRNVGYRPGTPRCTLASMPRDDLFTHIHKALRKGLFDLTVLTGSTDWTAPDEVGALEARWRPFLALLRSHSGHEDRHIFRVLDPHDPGATLAVGEQHQDLDDLLDHVAGEFDAAFAAPTPAAGLEVYRDLARFVAAYLPHLHEEETVVMARIWETCTDEEIAATRAAFMAELTPEETALSMELMLPALDRTTRTGLIGNLAGSAPPFVVDGVLGVAERVLPPADVARLREVLADAAA